jgi:lipoprotein NlpI
MKLTKQSRWVFALTLLLVGGVSVIRMGHVRAGSETQAATDARAAYNRKIVAHYNNRFGETTHFLPSLATSDDGTFVDPKTFPTAAYCGHCHQESHRQWRESAHSNSNRPPWYLRNVNLLKTEKGVEFSRHCEGCHDPIALLAGDLTTKPPARQSYDDDGITCSVCHSITKVDTRGTGSYVMGTPAVLVDEQGNAITRPVSDAEILAHLDRHSKAVMKDFYRTSQFCSACHEAALPKQLNNYKWLRAISLYDEWQASSFAKQSPLPFYVKPAVSTCQTCHMTRETLELRDPGAKEGKLASHRWLGANTLIPDYYKYPDQKRKTEEFLKNGVFNLDLFALEHGDSGDTADAGKVSAPLGASAFSVKEGERVTADLVIQNKGIGHSHVPEQRDMYESWVAFTVKDEMGRVIFESGSISAKGDLDPKAHSFTNRLINAKGTINDLHQVWDNRVVAYNNTVQSGRSQLVRYSFDMPKAVGAAVTITATVRYRRFDQHFLDFGMGKHYDQLVVDMVTTSRRIAVGDNAATGALEGENPEWMRWNNYGVGLLDAQQYAASVEAFQHVAKLRPDYADVYTNMAIVEIQWERFDEARSHLEQTLKLSPQNARALYYRALVERNQGKLDEAVADLSEVIKQFPLSRDAHRELGFSFYQQHKYPEATKEYEALQGIAPDDLAAHYNLSILYRRLHMQEKAAVEAAAFADQKDDPTATMYALEFLRKHNELANESVPWHTHELDPVKPAAKAATHVGGGQ